MDIPKVYVDTNIFKFSATELPRLTPRVQKIDWGGVQQDVVVHDLINSNPNENVNNSFLKEEADVLPHLAARAKQGRVRYLIQMEAELESWGLPSMDSKSGRFYGARLNTLKDQSHTAE